MRSGMPVAVASERSQNIFTYRGADLNWIGHDRKTPLDVARESGAGELVEWLLAHGAKRS